MVDQAPLRLVDDDGDSIGTITTDGYTLKPFLNAIGEFVDEARIHFTEDGIHALAVDSTNVSMIDAHVPASAFEDYNLDREHTIGVNVGMCRHLVRRARMHHDDTLTLRVHDRRLYATVTRGYDDSDVITEDRIDLVDPDSIRQEPDIPDLDLTEVDVSLDAFRDVTEHAAATSDYVEYKTNDGALLVESAADTMQSNARIPDAAPADVDVAAIYSEHYLSTILDAVKKAKTESIGVRFGDEMPVFISFTREEDGEELLAGRTMLAPRFRQE